MEGEGAFWCYSCGETDFDHFSRKQLNKRMKAATARCKTCIANNVTDQYAPFEYLYRYGWGVKGDFSLNKQLEDAVTSSNAEHVEALLKKGADPNYVRQLIAERKKYTNCYAYDEHGNEIPSNPICENGYEQPVTMLRLCVFAVSDSCISDKEHNELYRTAELLIRYGAKNAEDALYFYRHRYGIGGYVKMYKTIWLADRVYKNGGTSTEYALKPPNHADNAHSAAVQSWIASRFS
jgi:hypothetical protein